MKKSILYTWILIFMSSVAAYSDEGMPLDDSDDAVQIVDSNDDEVMPESADMLVELSEYKDEDPEEALNSLADESMSDAGSDESLFDNESYPTENIEESDIFPTSIVDEMVEGESVEENDVVPSIGLDDDDDTGASVMPDDLFAYHERQADDALFLEQKRMAHTQEQAKQSWGERLMSWLRPLVG